MPCPFCRDAHGDPLDDFPATAERRPCDNPACREGYVEAEQCLGCLRLKPSAEIERYQNEYLCLDCIDEREDCKSANAPLVEQVDLASYDEIKRGLGFLKEEEENGKE